MTLQSTNPLHLYRALLREVTYLFDPVARTWTQKYVIKSFRKNAGKVQDGKSWKQTRHNPDLLPSLYERKLLKRGRKFLVLLHRANHGYQRQLKNLLQLVYGRKGPQKRLLMAPLMKSGLQPVDEPVDAPTDVDTKDQSSNKSDSKRTQKIIRAWKAPEAFLSMLGAQNRLSEHLNIRRKLKPEPSIAAENKWGQPMPPSRIKNLSRGWYAKMADGLMPPVSESDWNRLKAVALRSHKFDLIPRRAMRTKRTESKYAEGTDQTATKLVLGVEKPAGRLIVMGINRPHHMTPRFLSRFYARNILNHCSVASPNPSGIGLVSKWDDGKRGMLKAERPKSTAHIETLFGEM